MPIKTVGRDGPRLGETKTRGRETSGSVGSGKKKDGRPPEVRRSSPQKGYRPEGSSLRRRSAVKQETVVVQSPRLHRGRERLGFPRGLHNENPPLPRVRESDYF